MVDSSLLHTFSVDVLSSNQQRYQGQFTTKKLSIRDLTTVGVRKVQLNGGMHWSPTAPGQGIDEGTDDLNSMIAHLEVALTSYPRWWNLDEITDMSVLGSVYREVISFENSFRGRGQTAEGEGPGGSGQADSASAQGEANPAGSNQQVVGEQVQASLEP
jgi:hypothetical protein